MNNNKKRAFPLQEHLTAVKEGEKQFENAFQAVSRMILGNEIEKTVVNGKTFFVEYLCSEYRQFLSQEANKKYTFRFKYLDKLGNYGKIANIESQTYEDPMILAMNLMENRQENKEFLARWAGFSDRQIETFYENYRPLGACSEYIWYDILNYNEGDVEKALNFIEIVPVPLMESMGTITGKYPAKDKITSSAVDLLGEESIQRLLHITDTNNPYRFDLRRGRHPRMKAEALPVLTGRRIHRTIITVTRPGYILLITSCFRLLFPSILIKNFSMLTITRTF
jgi:serine protein kinase